MSMTFRTAPSLFRAAALVTFAAGCAPAQTGAPAVGVRSSAEAVLAPGTPLWLHAEAAGGFATSVDERGVPTFIFATARQPPLPVGSSPLDAARFHAARFSYALGLQPEALAATEPALVQEHGEGGVIVQLRQRVGGVEVYGRQLRILMRQDHSLVALSGGLHPTTALVAGATFRRAPEVALAGALSHALGAAVSASAVVDLHDADGDRYQLAGSGAEAALSEDALVRKVLFPDGERLRPAYLVEFFAGRPGSGDPGAWRYVVAADDDHGTVLERVSLTQYDAFNYRVWANPVDKRPLDGPFADWTPHPTGRADWSYPPFIAPSLISMEGFNKNPMGAADPWLPATATETTGNNVEAFIDRNGDGAPSKSDFHSKTTSPGTFDHVYNLYKIPNPIGDNEQPMAGITQAFYDTNWLHDYWYDSGFNERAGNAQYDNYGRGGVNRPDRMLVKCQFNVLNGTRDNSSMSTPSDGGSPQMQVFIWSGRETRILHATPPDADQPSGAADFGPKNFDVDGTLNEVDDGTFPSATDACEPIRNDISGKVALIDRGSCTFKRKAVNAAAAGAIAVVIVNNVNGAAPGMANGDPMATELEIPVLSTTKAAGTAIRDLMQQGPVTMRLGRVRDIDRDGALDNTVIFHEWGHYLHHRLAACGTPGISQQCGAMSEGWGDFIALHTIARAGDNLNGTFAEAMYGGVAADDPGYFGIRRQPYSVDFRRNGLTLRHIADGEDLPRRQLRNFSGQNSEVHDAGEIWATMLWEVYVALQAAGPMHNPPRSFDDVRRLMADYVVTSLQATPPNATYTEARDALMAAAGARSVEDQTVIAEAFARRGAGTCADSPLRTSQTLEGVVEGFKVQPRLVIGAVTLDDVAGSCSDQDGVLDSGERGTLTIEFSNGALHPLVGAKLNLSSSTPQVSFTGPTTFDIPDLAPFDSQMVTTQVALDPKMADQGTFTLKIQPSSDAACENNGARELTWKINYDIGKQSTATDDVESSDVVWKKTGDDVADTVWQPIVSDAPNHVWHAADLDHISDTQLESPDLVVNKDAFFMIRFEHRHSFEAADVMNKRVYYDGGVIEISDDGGASWKDISNFAKPGYGGTIDSDTASPIGGQKAFVDKNYSWPKRDLVTMNLMDAFAGKTVRLRFRVATDAQNGEAGWDIDNIAFKGIDNKPFTGMVSDARTCGVPVAATGGSCSMSARAARVPALLALMLAAPLALLVVRRRRVRRA